MFDKRPDPMAGRAAKHRDDVFLPVLTPWQDGERKVAAVERAYRGAARRLGCRHRGPVFGLLFDLFRHKRHHATELPAIKPTVAEMLDQPGRPDLRAARARPGLPACSGSSEILDC